MEWLSAHMDNPGTSLSELTHTHGLICAVVDIDAPIQLPGASASAGPEPSAEQVAMLADMGFTSAQASKALREPVRSTRPSANDMLLLT